MLARRPHSKRHKKPIPQHISPEVINLANLINPQFMRLNNRNLPKTVHKTNMPNIIPIHVKNNKIISPTIKRKIIFT